MVDSGGKLLSTDVRVAGVLAGADGRVGRT
jgi:hypothetical protein